METACTSNPPHVSPLWAFQDFESRILRKSCRCSHPSPGSPFYTSTDGKLRQIWSKINRSWFWLLSMNRVWQKIMMACGFNIPKHYHSQSVLKKWFYLVLMSRDSCWLHERLQFIVKFVIQVHLQKHLGNIGSILNITFMGSIFHFSKSAISGIFQSHIRETKSNNAVPMTICSCRLCKYMFSSYVIHWDIATRFVEDFTFTPELDILHKCAKCGSISETACSLFHSWLNINLLSILSIY